MTLSMFPEPVPEPEPAEPMPGSKRRFWLILGTVFAVLLFGGSATYLLISSSHSHSAASAPGTFTPPADGDTLTDAPSDDPSAAPDASASVGGRPSHGASATPGTTDSPPPGGPGASVAPGAYHVADNLCPSVDLTKIKSAAGPPAGEPTDSQQGKSNYTDYGCSSHHQGSGGKVTVQVDAMIFADAAAASASFNDDKTPSVEPVSGIGSSAIGSTGGGPYYLIVLDGNLKFKIWTSVSNPSMRQAAIDTAKSTLPKLRT